MSILRKSLAGGVLTLAVAVLLAAGPARAQEPTAQPGQPPQMSPEEQKAMEAFIKAMTPGAPHQELARMAGSWTFEGTFWNDPAQPPTKSGGSAERTLGLGGRVLLEKVTSTMMGMPFEGFGMTGFDNVSGVYWSTWNDNMSTGVMLSTGKCANGRCEFVGGYNDPLTGKEKKLRMVSTHEADREVHQMFDQGPDGKEWKSMELVYTRKK